LAETIGRLQHPVPRDWDTPLHSIIYSFTVIVT
jgi:hypothetical protein